MRRTPSTNNMSVTAVSPAFGGIGAQFAAETSIVVSTWACDSGSPSISTAVPYPGSHPSTLNRMSARFNVLGAEHVSRIRHG